MAKKLFKVRYVGLSDIRIIHPYAWTPENKHIQEVPLEKAAELLTYPDKQFALVDPAQEPEIISFVEGDSRPVEELKKSRKRSKK